MKTLLMLILSGTCFAAPLEQIAKSLVSGEKTERIRAIEALNEIINDSKLSNEVRLEAIQLAVDQNVHESSELIIKYIDTYWVRKKSALSFEEIYPSVEALIALGDKAVPPLCEAIKREENQLRHRMMSYTLLRIMKKTPALAYVNKLLATDLTELEQMRLEAAKEEISKRNDYELPVK